ncbi:MAG: hypothetical protein CVV41_07590 [Candidatus Riflebacteria bacterium HGW-Riflebacteria-1]|jgi:tetratricopeptide (TPR) repeat protein|nr:MAG: hypothetical protein CVV41_07590 [Candidatus Riflebacteria bacterium HGW-Riflebacteria-1]
MNFWRHAVQYRKWLSAALLSVILMSQNGPAFSAIDHSQLFSDGEKAFAANDFGVAAENFASALKYAPENLRARFRYGQALFSLSRFAESHSQFQAVLQNSPNNMIARVYLAENLVKLGRMQDARTHLEWILRVQPGHARAREMLDSMSGIAPALPAQALPEQMPADRRALPVKTGANSPAKAPAKTVVKAADKIELQPYTVQSGAKTQSQAIRPVKVPAAKTVAAPAIPQARAVSDFSLESFMAAAQNSFLINLELARFHLESADLTAAAASLSKAGQLVRNTSDSRRFLEVQILTSMLHIYNRDFNSFGKQLINLKPALGEKSYQSFLNIYNQGSTLTNAVDQSRLAAGIAMGANHHAVAARLLLEIFVQNPDDQLNAHLLADAQMQSLDYKGAENTLVHLARNHTGSVEAHFNLARFYLTAFYQPELARRYAAHAASLKPGDARIEILLGLLDYSEGKIPEGVARIRNLLPKVDDPVLSNICRQIISDGDQSNAGKPADFISMLALPGAPHAHFSSYRMLGEDLLKQGSFLTAMKHFAAARDYAEIGRTYLGLASALNASGESELSALAAGYGLGAIEADLQQNPGNGRACLYTALYWYERNDKVSARKALNRGLAGASDQATRQRLTAMLTSLGS